MKKFYAIIFVILILSVSMTFADSSNFVPATYLDTEAKFDIPDNWIYEGVLFDENYSQKKYTFIKNLDVSMLYGMRNLKEEINKKMPFVSADNLLGNLSEENIVSILGSASQSTIEEKLYGKNKFYEFTKTQKVQDGNKTIDVNCIVDMMIEGDNIYSFSYIYKNQKDGIMDYGKALTSFTIKNANNEINNAVKEEIKDMIENKTEDVKPEVKEETNIEINETSNEVSLDVPKDEIKEEVKAEEKSIEEVKEDIKEKDETNISGEFVENIIEVALESGNDIASENVINEEKKEEIIEYTSEEKEFENLGVIQNTYKPKSWVESVFSIIINNPIILIGIIVLAIIEILIIRLIRKKRKEKNRSK